MVWAILLAKGGLLGGNKGGVTAPVTRWDLPKNNF